MNMFRMEVLVPSPEVGPVMELILSQRGQVLSCDLIGMEQKPHSNGTQKSLAKPRRKQRAVGEARKVAEQLLRDFIQTVAVGDKFMIADILRSYRQTGHFAAAFWKIVNNLMTEGVIRRTGKRGQYKRWQ